MKTLFILVILALASTLEAGRLRGCIETDVCNAIVFNQLVLTDIKEDLGSYSNNFKESLLSATEEMREATRNLTAYHELTLFDPKVLETCYVEGNSLQLDITQLELELKSPFLNEEGYQNDMSALHRSKATYEKEILDLQAEIRDLMSDVASQQEQIDFLSENVVKLGLALPSSKYSSVASICS